MVNDVADQPSQPPKTTAANDATDTGSFPVIKRRVIKVDRSTGFKILTSVMVVLLCALLGFGYVTGQRSLQTSYASLSESELVRLLDETNSDVNQLEAQKTKLQSQLESFQTAVDKRQEADRIAKENAVTSGILSGRLPTKGQGVKITVQQGGQLINATLLFQLVEELRNAGAEVIQVNDVRVVTSTSFTDTKQGVASGDTDLTAPYTVLAIGKPDNLRNAIEIPGGIGSILRVQYQAQVSIEQENMVKITKTSTTRDYLYAKTVE